MIRTAFDQGSELSAAVELRRLFPGITDNAHARARARTIAGWKPLPTYGLEHLIFSDAVSAAQPQHHKLAGLKVNLSNLCTEITFPTGIDQHGRDRTAVCCLSSLNLEHWHAWKNNGMFIEDITRFLDNVLQDFIDRAPPGMEKAQYSAMRERSAGLGVMGFHSFLQSQGVPWESVIAKSWNRSMFKHIRAEANGASIWLARERGPSPDAAEWGVEERFSHKLSIARVAPYVAGRSSCWFAPEQWAGD